MAPVLPSEIEVAARADRGDVRACRQRGRGTGVSGVVMGAGCAEGHGPTLTDESLEHTQPVFGFLRRVPRRGAGKKPGAATSKRRHPASYRQAGESDGGIGARKSCPAPRGRRQPTAQASHTGKRGASCVHSEAPKISGRSSER
jgi:hypothetical protein